MPVIPDNKVVDEERIIGKGGRGEQPGVTDNPRPHPHPPPPKKSWPFYAAPKYFVALQNGLAFRCPTQNGKLVLTKTLRRLISVGETMSHTAIDRSFEQVTIMPL
jgi:hypothetical protein